MMLLWTFNEIFYILGLCHMPNLDNLSIPIHGVDTQDLLIKFFIIGKLVENMKNYYILVNMF